MAESPTEKRLREVERSVTAIDEALKYLRKDLDNDRGDGKESAKTLADVQKELAVLKKDFDELKDRIKTKEAWFRTLVASAVVAALASVVTLIVALVRK